MGIWAMYNVRLYPDIDIGKIAVRIILCACNGCLEKLYSVWKTRNIDKEQKRYKTSNRSEIKTIFDGLDDCQLVMLDTNKNGDIDEDDLLKEKLHGIESNITKKSLDRSTQNIHIYNNMIHKTVLKF